MPDANKPLAALEEWEDFLKERYPEPETPAKPFQAVNPAKKYASFTGLIIGIRPMISCNQSAKSISD